MAVTISSGLRNSARCSQLNIAEKHLSVIIGHSGWTRWNLHKLNQTATTLFRNIFHMILLSLRTKNSTTNNNTPDLIIIFDLTTESKHYPSTNQSLNIILS